MNVIEINGNLSEEKDFPVFCKFIVEILKIFYLTFGEKVMEKYDLFIDNATKNSGHTPMATVLLKKHITIKLGIDNFSNQEQIAYQFSHELCHYVFYSLQGLNKEKAGVIEENICSAMSLVIIKLLFPKNINRWVNYSNNSDDERYNKGAVIAEECNFDINILKNKIYETCGIVYNR